MNLRKLSSLFRLVTATARTNHLKNRIEPVALFRQSRNRRWRTSHITNVGGCILLSSGFLSLFKRDSDDENSPEQKLIMTIKRSILCIQKEEYDKAEQMLHLALRMAQDLQSKDGITYVYDLMANLALEREQFKKAEKLFVDVMKRLFADGFKEDDIKVFQDFKIHEYEGFRDIELVDFGAKPGCLEFLINTDQCCAVDDDDEYERSGTMV